MKVVGGLARMKPETDAKGVNREAAAGLALLAAAVLALIVANSPLRESYENLISTRLQIGVPPFAMTKSLLLWINDGLMAVFFFVVGLEIKREVVRGALSNRKTASLPVIAAFGGMVVPAMIYASINWDNDIALRGWAIPAATDIAFAVGVLALLGSRVPPALKVFLLALAIIDDLGAILIIAFFYSSGLSVSALALAAAGIALLALLNRSNVLRVWPYLLVGAIVWLCVLKSGVHATLAGRRDGARGAADRGKERPGRAARKSGKPAQPLGQLRRSADLCLRQRRRIADRSHGRASRVADPARHRTWLADRKTARHLHMRTRGDQQRHRRHAGRRFAGAAFRHSYSRRHWLHYEPIHRHACIPRIS